MRQNTDNQQDKFVRLESILKKVAEFELSAYEIAKFTGLSDTGVRKILKREAENPSEKTIDKIQSYIAEVESRQTKKVQEEEITLATNNKLLKTVLEKLEKIETRIETYELMQELTFELLKNSSSPEELKNIEKQVRKKHNISN